MSGRPTRLGDLRLEPSGHVAYMRKVVRFRYANGRFWINKSTSIGSARLASNPALTPWHGRRDIPRGCVIYGSCSGVSQDLRHFDGLLR
jgi:hypothetical protein